MRLAQCSIIFCLLTTVFCLVTIVYCLTAGGTEENQLFVTEEVLENSTFKSKFFQNLTWTYDCKNNKCERRRPRKDEQKVTLETCNTMCSLASLWPKPKSVSVSNKNSSTFNKNRMLVKIDTSYDEVNKYMLEATNIFTNYLPTTKNAWFENADTVYLKIFISVSGNENRPNISTNESYSLSIIKSNDIVLVNITAPTCFGARHGLETLSQLIWLDTECQKPRIVHDVFIVDSPKFPHRGLMVDTARNFFPMKQLLKVVDGMAASKLNVFHLHLTDSVSFPIILQNNPAFAQYGAYGPDMVYTPEDIRGLIEYARVRGIRVVLEIDAPGHVNAGWNHDDSKEKLVICGENNIVKGQLNPDNTNIFKVLRGIYEDLLELGNETFHIGGDEVDLSCYNETKVAQTYSDPFFFWSDFINKILDTLKLANNNNMPKNVLMWSSPLTDKYLYLLNYKENLVVQYWYGEFNQILTGGYKIIFSTVGHWYLDCGFGPWKPGMTSGVCDPYTPWQEFYKYRPWEYYSNFLEQILGGEACLWSEQVDVDSLEIKIWPRAAAVAERLWSDAEHFDDYDVYTRLASHRERLIERGLKVAAMWPRWCTQNPGRC